MKSVIVAFAVFFSTAAAFNQLQNSAVRGLKLKSPKTVSSDNVVSVIAAGALPAVVTASPAQAALPDIAGLPGGVVLTFFPVIIAATVAILVIGPGAIQQFQRVFSGQSAKYMKGDY